MKIIQILIMAMPTLLFAQTAKDSLAIELSMLTGEGALTGFGIAIVDQDGVLYANGFGFTNQNRKIPYTTKTVQPIASISKTLLGISLIKAQELHLLDLDDDINDYLPFEVVNPHYPNKMISIRHLANHTSGIKDTRHYEKSYIFNAPVPKVYKELSWGFFRYYIRFLVRRYNRNIEIPHEEFLKNIYVKNGKWYAKKNFHKQQPGKGYDYSNNGAALASIIIEQASGMSYVEFTRKHIITPHNMNCSGWNINDYPKQAKSKLNMLGVEIPEYKLITLADGGFVTNIEDFSKFMIAVIQGYNGENNIITAAGYSEMLKENTTVTDGVFWSVKELDNSNYIGHSGFDPGVQSQVFFDIRDNTGYLFFTTTNTLNGEKDKAINIMRKYSSRIIR